MEIRSNILLEVQTLVDSKPAVYGDSVTVPKRPTESQGVHEIIAFNPFSKDIDDGSHEVRGKVVQVFQRVGGFRDGIVVVEVSSNNFNPDSNIFKPGRKIGISTDQPVRVVGHTR